MNGFSNTLTDKTLHIELTTRCTLACPACPRTEWKNLIGKPVNNIDLNYEHLYDFLKCNKGKQINKFILCGDYGDPIYYPKLFDFIEKFRNTKKFQIHTNGSYKNKKWWTELNKLLTKDDIIIFAIDGIKDNNLFYRKNADWNSIMTGIDISTSGPAKIQWQTIIFSFNENDLDQIKKFANSKGCEFFTLKTHRFGDESLKPKLDNTAHQYFFQDQFNEHIPIDISPRCNKTKTISADGHFMPCDWIRNPKTFYKSELFTNKEWMKNLKISNTNYTKANEIIQKWIDNVIHKGKKGTADVLCKMKCRKGCYGQI